MTTTTRTSSVLFDLIPVVDGLYAPSDCPNCGGTGVTHPGPSGSDGHTSSQRVCDCLLDRTDLAAVGAAVDGDQIGGRSRHA